MDFGSWKDFKNQDPPLLKHFLHNYPEEVNWSVSNSSRNENRISNISNKFGGCPDADADEITALKLAIKFRKAQQEYEESEERAKLTDNQLSPNDRGFF